MSPPLPSITVLIAPDSFKGSLTSVDVARIKQTAGLKTLEIMERDGVVENSRKMGERLNQRLQELRRRHRQTICAKEAGG